MDELTVVTGPVLLDSIFILEVKKRRTFYLSIFFFLIGIQFLFVRLFVTFTLLIFNSFEFVIRFCYL